MPSLTFDRRPRDTALDTILHVRHVCIRLWSAIAVHRNRRSVSLYDKRTGRSNSLSDSNRTRLEEADNGTNNEPWPSHPSIRIKQLFPRTSDAMSENNYHDLRSMNNRQDERDVSCSREIKNLFILIYTIQEWRWIIEMLMNLFYKIQIEINTYVCH